MKKICVAALVIICVFALQACVLQLSGSNSGHTDQSGETEPSAQSVNSAAEVSAAVSVSVKEVFHETVTEDHWGTEYTNEYSIPALDTGAANAQKLNKQIYDKFYGYYTEKSGSSENLIHQISYTWSVYRGIISIKVTHVAFVPMSDVGDRFYDIYYYDCAGDRIIETGAEYIEAFGYTLEQLNSAVKKMPEYTELFNAGYWYGGSDYEWDTVELAGCIFGEETTELMFDCTYGFDYEGTHYTSHVDSVQTVKTADLLGNI